MSTHKPSGKPTFDFTRRAALKQGAVGILAAGTALSLPSPAKAQQGARRAVPVRGIYGGYPSQILDRGEKPADYGVNAIWVGSSALRAAEIARYHDLGMKVFAEFNSMHAAQYLKEHPDAAPLGPDGKPSPPPRRSRSHLDRRQG